MACPSWHRLGERCECGHIGTPARFYGPTGDYPQDKAQAAYLEWAKAEMPELYARTKPVTSACDIPEPVTKTCDTCGHSFAGHGRQCPRCRKARSRHAHQD
jgi:hypothetical protein